MPSPAPTATLLVATDPDLTAGPAVADGGGGPGALLLGAAPVPVSSPQAAPVPTAVEPVAWVQEAAAWGAPLVVGGALLLALTGPSWLRRLRRNRTSL
ncbi:hypothetical protein [Quadrisphaera sp. INWT6]|uniref:hypothetical protein n=1 Tax=Quadrisphaera sp. INWT6 TaxID=2596917 RepID=UPI0018923F26|nr:hypothetical protein [Quadrisphaera sp. INWT6]